MNRQNRTNCFTIYFRKRVLLAFLLSVAMLLTAFPGTVLAASASIGWNALSQLDSMTELPQNIALSAEAGQTFYLSDYISRKKDDTFISGPNLPIIYSSNDRSVASINKSSGKITLKKNGTAVITATYQGTEYTCAINVLDPGDLKSTTTYKALNQYAKKLAAYYGKAITSKNIAKALIALGNYEREYDARNMLDKKLQNPTLLFVPLQKRCDKVKQNIENYIIKNGPLNDYGNFGLKKAWKVKSVTASAADNTLTLTLKKKITKPQLYCLQYLINADNCVGNMRKFPQYSAKTMTRTYHSVIDYESPTDNKYMWDTGQLHAKATFKAGSNKVVLELYTASGKRFIIQSGARFTTDESVWGAAKTGKAK